MGVQDGFLDKAELRMGVFCSMKKALPVCIFCLSRSQDLIMQELSCQGPLPKEEILVLVNLLMKFHGQAANLDGVFRNLTPFLTHSFDADQATFIVLITVVANCGRFSFLHDFTNLVSGSRRTALGVRRTRREPARWSVVLQLETFTRKAAFPPFPTLHLPSTLVAQKPHPTPFLVKHESTFGAHSFSFFDCV